MRGRGGRQCNVGVAEIEISPLAEVTTTTRARQDDDGTVGGAATAAPLRRTCTHASHLSLRVCYKREAEAAKGNCRNCEMDLDRKTDLCYVVFHNSESSDREEGARRGATRHTQSKAMRRGGLFSPVVQGGAVRSGTERGVEGRGGEGRQWSEICPSRY